MLVPTAYNAFTGEPVKNVFFQLYKEQCQFADEGLSNENGFAGFSLKQLGIH